MTSHPIPANDLNEATFDALLPNAEMISIVDGLFALPGENAYGAESDRWARAVQSRMQARLAERMRQAMGAGSS